MQNIITKVEELRDAYKHPNAERENAYSQAIDDVIKLLQKCEQSHVIRSAEFEKPKIDITNAEILEGAKRLWKVPMKLDAVKQVMRLGYSLKDAKTYCEQHFV